MSFIKRTALIWPAVLLLAAAGILVWRLRPREHPAPPARIRDNADRAGGRETTVTLYFANPAYIESGDEDLPHLLAEERPLPAESLAEAAVRALQTNPRGGNGRPVIRGNLKIRRVAVRDGLAEVDLARSNLFGGSLEELLLIEGVVRTLTGLPGIKAVRFLVDGEPTDSLMGHFSADRPLTPADIP